MWALIDIGGTSVKCLLLESEQEGYPKLKAVWRHRFATPKGVKAFTACIEHVHQTICKECTLLGEKLEAVSIGFPANMSLDDRLLIVSAIRRIRQPKCMKQHQPDPKQCSRPFDLPTHMQYPL